jgi:hypothetical protein
MELTVASTETTKPKGRKAKGRTESPIWGQLAEAILNQAPGVWTTYNQFLQTPDAVRVGTRLRQAENFEDGKAFAPLRDRVKVAIVDTGEKDGKKIATLSIVLLADEKAEKPARKTAKKS